MQTLAESGGGLCDDCLSVRSGVKPRQQVHQRATELHEAGTIAREKRTCPSCGHIKLVNSVEGDVFVSSEKPVSVAPSSAAKWSWEGNIQSAIVAFLTSKGCRIVSVAKTATREPGKDIEAHTPDGRRLWVSVKGWPEKSENTQARHWFSQALMDMILYREENPQAELAIGLPAGFSTYENLWKRITWFRRALPLRTFWVSRDGSVSEAA